MEEGGIGPSQRRVFLSWMLGAVGATLGAAAGWSGLRYLTPQQGGKGQEQVTVTAAEVPVGGVKFFEFHGRPAVLVQPEPGSFVALSAVCTHLGCIVKWEADRGSFLCPCHAGRFSAQGQVLGGPPPQPLTSFPVAVRGDRLVIG